MDCNFCKNSRKLRYHDTVEVRLPFERNVRNVEIVEDVITHVFCLAKRQVVVASADNAYCEHEYGVFDDYPVRD